MRADFDRRDTMRRKQFEDTLNAVREQSTRTPAEVAELRDRLTRLESTPAVGVVDLDN